ncbi:DUF3993 domain-containing protein [Bacillus sp. FJAT-42376]|uniref:DUF3993 domain-containing protein n=1 Tax=Bacillus sp. FJAT-42376 TaxID=2014076 RepID=UPI000F4F34E7|nr:DUF3993 domain-containing protein [Bacillus sp. FJAT-42376]AZB42626.1 DUF3993 domain-containing protein [Bacillus sp. FJAT-42376]
MKTLTSLSAAAVIFFSLGSPAVGETAAVTADRPAQHNAQKANPKETVFKYLQDASYAQVSLSEKERTKAQMKEVLAPYFTDEIADAYLKYNAVKGETQYIVYGTDFPILSLPFFSYDESTKIKQQKNKTIVYQYFKKTDTGPVTFEGHYEAVTMIRTDGAWKISSISESKEEPN